MRNPVAHLPSVKPVKPESPEVQHRHQNSEHDPGSFGGVAGCTRATPEHARHKCA